MPRYPLAPRSFLIALTLACAGVGFADAGTGGQGAGLARLAGGPLQPLPGTTAFDPDKVALGRRLFFDTCFSADNAVSCASCHDFALGLSLRRSPVMRPMWTYLKASR